jgi:hypothetical protein
LRGWAIAQGATQARGMKVRASVKKLCEGCKVCFVVFSQHWTFWVGCGLVLGLGLVGGEVVVDVTMLVWLGFFADGSEIV